MITANIPGYLGAGNTLPRRASNPDPSIPVPGRVVVTGTGFGTKPFSSQQIWETFGGSVGTLVKDYSALWEPYNGSIGAVITDLDSRYSGHRAAYSDPSRGGDFLTNHLTFAQSDKVYVSRYQRVHSYRGDGHSGGVTKFQRVTSSTSAGGGGVYNGEGVAALGGQAPASWYASWSGSENLLNNLGYLNGSWYPINSWKRIEYEIQLNDIDVANGFFNVHVHGHGSILSGNIMQRKTGYTRTNYLLDTVLLGVESPNQWPYYYPNVLAANTDYSITKNGNTYTFNSPSVPTASEILNNLAGQLTTAGITARVWNNAEINVTGVDSAVYSSNFTQSPPYGMSDSEIFLDVDFKRFYIGNASTWAACTEANPQPYVAWTDTTVVLDKYVGGITGRTWLYKQLLPNVTPELVGEIVDDEVV